MISRALLATLVSAGLVACSAPPAAAGTSGGSATSAALATQTSGSAGASGAETTTGGTSSSGRSLSGSTTSSPSTAASTTGAASSAGTSGGSASGLPPPAQAAAAGFHTLVFNQGGDAGWSVDSQHTGAPGFAWYESGGFFGASNAETSTANGILTIASKSMASATRQLVDNDAGYVGAAFGGGFYVEADLAIDGGCVPGGSGVFSAFWGLPVEKELVLGVTDDWPGQVKGYEHYVELDFMEYWGSYTSFYTLDWWGVWQHTCASGFCVCGNNGGCHGVPDNGPDNLPAATRYADFNLYGALVVPAAANDGGTGYTQGYFNNAPTPSHNSWAAYDPAIGPPPSGRQIFAATDVGHYYLIANTTPGCALQLAHVRVWQAP